MVLIMLCQILITFTYRVSYGIINSSYCQDWERIFMISDDKFLNLKVGLLGAGIENLALGRYLINKGAQVVLYDKHNKDDLVDKLKRFQVENIDVVGGDYLTKISEQAIYFRIQGMPLAVAQAAVKDKGKLSSAMQLFFEICPATIIGVTGTKGKGTTASLIGLILEKAMAEGLDGKVYVMGNIGKAPFEIIEKLTDKDWVVMELSSFQLEDMTRSPHMAVILGITPDHLAPLSEDNPNFHQNFEDYVQAKRHLVEFQTSQDFAVLVKDNDASASFAKYTQAHVDYCSLDKLDEGSFIENGWILIRHKDKKVNIMPTAEIPLAGSHNIINAMAAAMVGYLIGVSPNIIEQAIKEYKGLPHRLEFVRALNHIQYYDDSYATGPDATIAAIKAFEQPVVIILGGSAKGADFNQLAKTIKASTVKAAILIGDEAASIEKALVNNQVNIQMIKDLTTMPEIVRAANELAKAGDVVLLSPACASFGLFRNASDRGDQFKSIINQT